MLADTVRVDAFDAETDLERERLRLDLLRRRAINVVGHALQTPVATIRASAEVLAGSPPPEVRTEVVQRLLASARQLEELLDDVLVVSGIDTRLPVARPEDLVPAEVVRAVATERSPDLAVHVEEGEDVQLRCDRATLEWILRHVLDNAARYGSGPLHVEVERLEGWVVTSIWTPEGTLELRPGELDNAFEVLFRGEEAVTAATARLGLGLPTARRLAEHAGGSLVLTPRGDSVAAVLTLPAP